ncbi:hypothetical protein TNCV_1307981 [Trichonephila clavipes]|nr:hypothetical protein TNCV_1307981 [Trichonephila clavipes]
MFLENWSIGVKGCTSWMKRPELYCARNLQYASWLLKFCPNLIAYIYSLALKIPHKIIGYFQVLIPLPNFVKSKDIAKCRDMQQIVENRSPHILEYNNNDDSIQLLFSELATSFDLAKLILREASVLKLCSQTAGHLDTVRSKERKEPEKKRNVTKIAGQTQGIAHTMKVKGGFVSY